MFSSPALWSLPTLEAMTRTASSHTKDSLLEDSLETLGVETSWTLFFSLRDLAQNLSYQKSHNNIQCSGSLDRPTSPWLGMPRLLSQSKTMDLSLAWSKKSWRLSGLKSKVMDKSSGKGRSQCKMKSFRCHDGDCGDTKKVSTWLGRAWWDCAALGFQLSLNDQGYAKFDLEWSGLWSTWLSILSASAEEV